MIIRLHIFTILANNTIIRRAVITTSFLFLAAHILTAQTINIWEGTSCKKKVELTLYPSGKERSTAIIVCPGGSYYWHDMENEGHKVGLWLQSNGITAFVLQYRTAGIPAFATGYRYILRGNRYPDPQDDLRQAMRTIKSRANEWRIDTARIGAMGFSAGGHLVMSAAELFDKEDRPAFVAPIYPVVTMKRPYVHTRSRRGLLGDNRSGNKELRARLSLEDNVPNDCAPVFLVNCKDDPTVKYQNSELLDSALTAHNINHRYIQYETGGHGFGASEEKGSEESRQWRQEFLLWLKTILK